MFNFYSGLQATEGFPMIYFNPGHQNMEQTNLNDYWLHPYANQFPTPFLSMENFWNSNPNSPQIPAPYQLPQPYQVDCQAEKVQKPEMEEERDQRRIRQKKNDVKIESEIEQVEVEREKRQMKTKAKVVIKKESGPKKFPQNRGRNQNSNIYRAFLKLIKNKGYRKMLGQKIQKIVKYFEIPHPHDQFTDNFLSELPPFTNYVNKSEFMRIYTGKKYESKIFKHLFDDFIRNEGYLHLLTIKYFKKVKKESISDFLSAMRNTKEQLIDGVSEEL